MDHFVNFDQLTESQLTQYRKEVALAFPPIIQKSQIVLNYWDKVERYFPEYQRILIDQKQVVVGLVCTLPFFWDRPLANLPQDGWDWLMGKGIDDFENGRKPTHLGGLQIVISQAYKGKGLSKKFIAEGKSIMTRHNLQYFALPIRPTLKHQFPAMPMETYIKHQQDGKVYDPWIRTHLTSGAQIIKVCSNAMTVIGDIPFWESLTDQKITKSGSYTVKGALNLIEINIDQNIGEYHEDNIWIYYPSE